MIQTSDSESDRLRARQQVLVADDNPRLLASLASLLSDHGFRPVTASNGSEACRLLQEHRFTMALLDLNMPGRDGFQVMEEASRLQPDCALVVVSGETSFRAVSRALRRGASDYIRKPFDPDEVLATLENVLGKQSLMQAHEDVQQRLEKSESLHRYIVNNSPDIVFMLDGQGRFCFLNRKVVNLLGYQPADLLGKHFRLLLDDEEASRSKLALKNPGISADHPVSFEVCLRASGSDRATRHFEITAFPISDDSWRTLGDREYSDLSLHARYYGIARDVTERKEAEAFISFQAYHDLLTRLPNRALFRDRLNMALNHASRHHQQLAVMFLDLDRFKIINDTLGHTVGDRLLQAVTQRLERCLRKGDTLSRFGGDEFTLLLPAVPDREHAAVIANKLIDTLREPFVLDNQDIYIGVSIGIAMFPEAGDTIEHLIRNADLAMYQVKSRGKDGYCFFDSSMTVDSSERLTLERDLRRAISEGELRVHYQPQVCLRTRRITGLEALVRWQHPERGLLLPADFLPLASETNLISEISHQVLKNACEEVGQWIAAGHQDLRLAVNLSPVQVEHPLFTERLMSQLRQIGFPPANLEIEITENVIMNDLEQVSHTLRELAGHGVRIAIDDFGTGYSSLNYLHHLPIHTLKIDRSFVHGIRSGNDGACIVNAIIAMAQGLKLEIVAEGVETQDQLDYLSTSDCDLVQGFLFGRAQPGYRVAELLGHQALPIASSA
ncbi:PAS domain S-box-containing protein/diguanylate cyclase (GGDEF) domain-containing protein [Marinobacter segnicrescens]|uniref:cyclic-guanylate-specific phosphodiesterase n=1 Tax=Marinobacter segnicrescens TaxID=430453 RepID=A0A1I0EY15_9GAMM|nr:MULTISPECIES: EAL domain-containing protein [Marinobacter]UZD64773.1 EAL domain-containing protein [Marinobacter sp. AN1]SET50574.1 PAS domain S-box-containing protein/diguanylate cyclase (GGDEF) domain-containing protein [Marinobacter segnicrescens]